MDSPEERLAAGGIHHVDAAALDAALAARPARPVLRCGTNAEVDAVLADPPAPLQGPQLADLEALAARLQRAEQVVARTRRRVRADTEARLASSAALAVHPETVRARADAVLRAREALVAAERELAQLAVPDEAPVPSPSGSGDPAPEPAAGEDAALRVRRNRAVGLVLAAVGLAVLLVALDAAPLWVALLVVFATSVAALRLLNGRDDGGDDPVDDADSTSLLAQMDAFTGAGARAADPASARRRLETRRTLAEEELRLAERAWHDLAGPDADVADLDAVIRRFDPQLEAVEQVVDGSVSVRAAVSAAQQLREAWRAAWAELHLAAPDPADGGLDGALRALREQPAPVTVVLAAPVADRAEEVAARLPTAAVLVVRDAGEPAST